LRSVVTEDKITCVCVAPNAELIREHARRGGFPHRSRARGGFDYRSDHGGSDDNRQLTRKVQRGSKTTQYAWCPDENAIERE